MYCTILYNFFRRIVRKLLKKAPELADVRTGDDNRMMPLHLACLKSHSGVADILLDTVSHNQFG